MKDRRDDYTLDMFDSGPDEGTSAKYAGIQAVLNAQRAKWRSDYRRYAEEYFAGLAPWQGFTGEIMHSYIRARVEPPTHPNAYGAMFNSVLRGWLKQGRVVETGELVKAKIKALHAHQYRVYQKVLLQ